MDDIVERLRSAAHAVLAGRPVAVAYLFGSHARHQARPDSDVDVALLMPAASPDERFAAQLRIGSRLSTATGLPDVDVVVLDDAPLRVAGRVIQEGTVIYSADEGVRAEYESRVFREFVDFSVLADALDLEMIRLTADGRR